MGQRITDITYQHDSIPTAVNALKNLGPNVNVQFNATEDETVFQDAKLAGYDAIVFLSNTGEGETIHRSGYNCTKSNNAPFQCSRKPGRMPFKPI